jgi:GNAT superfamily N-acetyltransferase
MVTVAEGDGEIVGFVSVKKEKKKNAHEVGGQIIYGGYYIDKLFVRPDRIRRGIGERLLSAAMQWCRKKRVKKLYVISDPNAMGFYEKMGFVYIGEVKTSIAGRTLPVFVFSLYDSL